MKLINYKVDDKFISITIPVGLLQFVAEHHPEMKLKVIEPKKFAEDVVDSLQFHLRPDENGLSSFENLIDEAIQDVYTRCPDNVLDLEEDLLNQE